MADDQQTRTERHREKNPGGESERKQKQRNTDAINLFHIKRKHIAGINPPPSVDMESESFKRQLRAFTDQVRKNVEITSNGAVIK